jgi:sphingomyelin phosphodiesterase
MYYVQNYWLYRKTMLRDPNNQFEWLVTELDKAEMAGERVWIIGHMSVGAHDAFHDQSNYLDQIVNRYSYTIAGMFYGHTHKDHFQISYSDYKNRKAETASAMSYIGPSLTPTSGMPAFRVYLVDPVTFAVLDHETYITDMSDPSFQKSPVWKKYYSAKEAYAPLLGNSSFLDPTTELTPAFWHRLTEVFERNQDAFNHYVARKSRGWDVQSCDGVCRDLEICELRAARAQDNCFDPAPGVHFKKRAENPQERDECGISVSRATMGSLAVRGEGVMLLRSVVAAGDKPI